MSVRVRIAPSPTGNLHIGTARTAVFNWLYARHYQGQMILRIEDTDHERSRPEYTQNILDSLAWLGLDFQEGPIFQTDRLDRYREVVQQLLAKGQAYYCYCSEAELEELRTAQKAVGKASRYDNRHRNLTAEQRAAFEAEGRQPVIRFRIEEPRTVSWHDAVRGEITWSTSDLGGDMVIARANGQPLYNLAVVIDDIDMAISHIIRGEDHIGNTPKQILLYEALGAAVPIFAHAPLILNPEGRKLSKRDGATSVAEFQSLGYLPAALKNYLALLSWSPPDAEELFSLEAAAPVFELDRITKAGARFDWDKLNWVNSQYINRLSAAERVAAFTPFWDAAGYDLATLSPVWLEAVGTLIGEGLTLLIEAPTVSRYLFVEAVEPDAEALAQLQLPQVAECLVAIASELPAATDSLDTLIEALKALIQSVTKAQGVKKGLIMKSLRAALTGSMHGPDLVTSFALLQQRGWALARLEAAAKV